MTSRVNIEFYCSKCTPQVFNPNYHPVDNLEILQDIVKSNFCTFILYDILCEDCKKIRDNFADLNCIKSHIWHGFIRKFGLYVQNKEYVTKYGYYILKDCKIWCDLSGAEISEENFFNNIRDGTVFTECDDRGQLKEFPRDTYGISVTKQTIPEHFGYIGAKGIRGLQGISGSEYNYKKYNNTIRQKISDAFFTIEEICIGTKCYFYRITRPSMTKPARKI